MRNVKLLRPPKRDHAILKANKRTETMNMYIEVLIDIHRFKEKLFHNEDY